MHLITKIANIANEIRQKYPEVEIYYGYHRAKSKHVLCVANNMILAKYAATNQIDQWVESCDDELYITDRSGFNLLERPMPVSQTKLTTPELFFQDFAMSFKNQFPYMTLFGGHLEGTDYYLSIPNTLVHAGLKATGQLYRIQMMFACETGDYIGQYQLHVFDVARSQEHAIVIEDDALTPAEVIVEMGKELKDARPEVSLHLYYDADGSTYYLVHNDLDLGTLEANVMGIWRARNQYEDVNCILVEEHMFIGARENLIEMDDDFFENFEGGTLNNHRLKMMKLQIAQARRYAQNLDAASFKTEEGILLTVREAERMIHAYEASIISEKSVCSELPPINKGGIPLSYEVQFVDDTQGGCGPITEQPVMWSSSLGTPGLRADVFIHDGDKLEESVNPDDINLSYDNSCYPRVLFVRDNYEDEDGNVYITCDDGNTYRLENDDDTSTTQSKQ